MSASTSASETGLLPCPFCGDEARFRETEREDNDRAPRPHRVYIVECTSCDATLEDMSSHWWSGATPPTETDADRSARARVIAAWNRRAPSHAALLAEVEILKEALKPFAAHSKANSDFIGTEADFSVHVTGWKRSEISRLTVAHFRTARAALEQSHEA